MTTFLVFILSFSLSAQNADDLLTKKIRKYSLDADHIGAYITVGENDEVLLSKNAEKKMVPASLTKITTASAVLAHFLPGSKFKTQLYLDKKNIYLKGGGDPSFVSENMWFLVNSFKRHEAQAIEGD